MSAKKLLLASISVVCLQASVQGDEWGLVRCLKECTNVSCADAIKQETCKTNCASNLGSIDACMKAKPKAPRRLQGQLLLRDVAFPSNPSHSLYLWNQELKVVRSKPSQKNRVQRSLQCKEDRRWHFQGHR